MQIVLQAFKNSIKDRMSPFLDMINYYFSFLRLCVPHFFLKKKVGGGGGRGGASPLVKVPPFCPK